MKRLRNICRIDNASLNRHGWHVQIQRGGNSIKKMFSDSVFGGKQKAFAAAIEFRESLITSLSSAEYNLWHRTIVRRNNTSGIPGVGLYKGTNDSEKWVAFWTDENGIKKSRTYSVSIHGKRKAKQLAIAERQRQLERIVEIKKTQVGWPNDS
ncbi:AP2/ERF family transcription factor [Propionivibrio sp.]|uniref:AP2/ERF family transcription factor n=1 Tax=Propionivibrio sp. TaxID=2212460 RepID=UPI002613671A|nr:AP2/ERF family transcription factor [Propionivibrio sp.]